MTPQELALTLPAPQDTLIAVAITVALGACIALVLIAYKLDLLDQQDDYYDHDDWRGGNA